MEQASYKEGIEDGIAVERLRRQGVTAEHVLLHAKDDGERAGAEALITKINKSMEELHMKMRAKIEDPVFEGGSGI